MGFFNKNKPNDSEGVTSYFSGKYVGGHPDAPTPIPVTTGVLTDSEIVIHVAGIKQQYAALHGLKQPKELGAIAFRIPVSSITNVVVEDASTVEKRVTMTRLLTVGVFAFGAKKKKVHSEFYVTLTWGAGKIPNETIFEFEGQNAQTQANQWRSIIVKQVNAEVV
jgi:hypothetical protein